MKPVSQRVGVIQSIAAAMLRAGLVDEILAFVTMPDGSGIIPDFIVSEQEAYKITTASYNPCSLAKMVAQYGDRTKKLGVVVRSCDARAIIELSKLKQLDLDNIYLIGIECYGTASLEEGLGMGLYIYQDRMEVDGVERVLDERLIRPNCLRCEYPIPSMADVSLSIDERSPCISVFSDKGRQVLEAAGLSAEGEDVRDLDSLRARATQWQERHFKDLGEMAAGDRLSYWLSLFNRCIKCYKCRDSCPLCYCRECAMEPDGGWREDRPCKTACMDACPIHTNVPGYIKLIAEGRFKEAYKLIRETNPLPSSVARVCYAPCQEACNRGQIDEALCIRDLKRVPGDQWNIEGLEVPTIAKTDKKVAIIGSGPAGLAAANDLVLKGHNVTILEALPEAGGMLRVGIPEYRLPKKILRQEIAYIQKLGVEMKTGVRVGKDITLEELRKDYDAIFIAVGAHGGMRLGVEGEDTPGVIEGVKFLRAANFGEKVKIGERVAVIGGGNTAIDCARTAKRLGAKEVTIVYRRSRAEMPASAEEVAAAEEEEIKVSFLTTPTRFFSQNGKLARMECIQMKLGEPDASARPRPSPIEGSEFTTPVDTVIAALGQTPETKFVRELGVSLSKGGTIEIDSKTGATNVEGVFSGGDVVTGPANVVDALAAGKKAARSINQYLKGGPLEPEEGWKEPEKFSKEEIEDRKGRFPSKKRINMRGEPAKQRIKDFREVSLGYSLEEGTEEASRCLSWQVERGALPPDMMFHLIRLIHVAPHCVNCGQCESVCPAGIPVSKLYHMLCKELASIFHYEVGVDVNVPPPLATIGEGEQLLHGVTLD
jgi:NADPH-dependent glutamate synthase beta subunit-like oxidoreductase